MPSLRQLDGWEAAGSMNNIAQKSDRHATTIAADLRKLATAAPDHAHLLNEAATALYRQASTIALVKGAFKGSPYA